MERRILVNYRVDPEVLAPFLPSPFRPTLVGGVGIAGICLIRLGDIRPLGLPAALGIRAENAAHRVAVEWDSPHGPIAGVYIHRRDTTSRAITVVGGRLFPGWHHRARFDVTEEVGAYRIVLDSLDGQIHVAVEAHEVETVAPGSVFASLSEASEFFRRAPIGYATTPNPGLFDGIRLDADQWAIGPLHLELVESSLFDSPSIFPPGTVQLDSAFLMHGLDTTWTAQPDLAGAQSVLVAE
jgi:hypothetical protein